MAKKAQTRQETQAVGFYLGTDEYAITIAKVREIQSMTEIRKVPRAPKFVEGVISLRGKIHPVIDLRKRFEMPPAADPSTSKILIIEFNRNLVGLIVDAVSEVIRLYTDQIEKTPDIFSLSIDSRYIQGVVKLDERLIILLDVDQLLSFEEASALAGMKP